jgi:hypothetical protein
MLNNFSTLTSIISALSTAPIHRLNRTWQAVNARNMAILESMRKLMGSIKNFAEYRETLHKANPPCIPFLGKLSPMSVCSPANRSRCLPHGSNLHRRRNPLFNQEDQSHQLWQAREDGRSDSRHPTIPERAVPATARP